MQIEGIIMAMMTMKRIGSMNEEGRYLRQLRVRICEDREKRGEKEEDQVMLMGV